MEKVSEFRTQIYMPKKDMQAVRLAAKEKGISVAAYIREAVQEHVKYGCRRYRPLSPDHPLNKLVGIAQGDAAPVAQEHDTYLTQELRWIKKK